MGNDLRNMTGREVLEAMQRGELVIKAAMVGHEVSDPVAISLQALSIAEDTAKVVTKLAQRLNRASPDGQTDFLFNTVGLNTFEERVDFFLKMGKLVARVEALEQAQPNAKLVKRVEALEKTLAQLEAKLSKHQVSHKTLRTRVEALEQVDPVQVVAQAQRDRHNSAEGLLERADKITGSEGIKLAGILPRLLRAGKLDEARALVEAAEGGWIT